MMDRFIRPKIFTLVASAPGRVAFKRSVSLSLAEPSLFDYEEIPRPAHSLMTSILCS